MPANEWFNYRFSFLVNARVFEQDGYSVSAATNAANGITAVPEPASIGLAGAGILLLAWNQARRRAQLRRTAGR